MGEGAMKDGIKAWLFVIVLVLTVLLPGLYWWHWLVLEAYGRLWEWMAG